MSSELSRLNIHMLPQSAILACRFCILVPSHYRDDKTCKCNDPDERAMMIREWGYKAKDFNGIPLRTEEQS